MRIVFFVFNKICVLLNFIEPPLLWGLDALFAFAKYILAVSISIPAFSAFALRLLISFMKYCEALTGYLPAAIPFLCGISPLKAIAHFFFKTSSSIFNESLILLFF